MALSGRFRSALVIGGQGIRARKLRTALSVVSLFLGVLAVVAVQAGSEIAHRALLADVELSQGRDGAVLATLPGHPRGLDVVREVLRDHPDVVATTSTLAVLGEPNTQPVNPGALPFEYAGMGYGGPDLVCDSGGTCRPAAPGDRPKPDGQAISLMLTGLIGDIRQFRPFPQQSGQWLSFDGAPSLSPGLVLNKEAAAGLSRYTVPAQLHVDGAPVDATPRILGVVDDGSSQPTAYLRADELHTWLDPARGAQMSLYLWPSAESVVHTLRARFEAVGSRDGIYERTIDSQERIGSQLALMRWIFLGMAVLVLLIGVAGILNVGLATVGERVEEFALRRAVGTPRVLLAGIVLSETLITGLLTAGSAIGAGALGLQAAERLFGSQHAMLRDLGFPWQAGVAGIVAGVAAGVLGGLLPAIRAARIPIAAVMRA
ncbi:ABC transporter permease [Actinokineospora bangkokensis]|uniref:Permease n=1 Tax=Actinokineospora bangkokensis TaxID=1193682 RepID=A0A1Q9LHZ9_9PSEU|nr:ABC transporter permease [Actinokineospora bangkokensis]OLR91630.1 permease [Actinokineospora bangkokensis]